MATEEKPKFVFGSAEYAEHRTNIGYAYGYFHAMRRTDMRGKYTDAGAFAEMFVERGGSWEKVDALYEEFVTTKLAERGGSVGGAA